MKTLWKIICLIARLAAVFAVLSLLAQWLSRGMRAAATCTAAS